MHSLFRHDPLVTEQTQRWLVPFNSNVQKYGSELHETIMQMFRRMLSRELGPDENAHKGKLNSSAGARSLDSNET